MAEPVPTERRVSALGDLPGGRGSGAVTIDPIGFRTLLNLRGQPDDAAFLDAVESAFGVALPLEANRWSGQGAKAALWLGPDEWLLMAPDAEATTVEDAIRAALPDDPWLSVVDLSHNFVGISLAGPAARDVLTKGCPLDLHPRAFPAGACAQTILAKSRVLLGQVDESPRFELWVRNSFARYVVAWLVDAAHEYNRDARHSHSGGAQ